MNTTQSQCRDFVIASERKSSECVMVKRMYVEAAGDLIAGILLSQIIYWHMPNKYGDEKLRVQREGELWLAKKRSDWWEECYITPKQYDRAIKVLETRGLVETGVFKFDGNPTNHVKPDWQKVAELWTNTEGENETSEEVKRKSPDREEGNSPKGNKEIAQTGNSKFTDGEVPLTETTAENTTETTTSGGTSSKTKPKKSNSQSKKQTKPAMHDQAVENAEIPPKLNTPEFLEAWDMFTQDRRDRDKYLTEQGVIGQLRRLKKYPLAVAIQALEEAVANGWQGTFPHKVDQQQVQQQQNHQRQQDSFNPEHQKEEGPEGWQKARDELLAATGTPPNLIEAVNKDDWDAIPQRARKNVLRRIPGHAEYIRHNGG